MNDQYLLFLKLLESELARTVLPAIGNDLARQSAGAALQEVKRILVEETVVRQLRTEACSAYRELLPALRGLLDTATHARLDAALAATPIDAATLDDALGAALAELQKHNEAAAVQLCANMVAIDARVRQGKETAWMERAKTPPPPADASTFTVLDDGHKARLLDFLKRKFPAESELRVVDVKPLVGGFSKQTLFVDLADNVELPSRLVMRRDPPYVTQGTSVTDEFPILQQVHAAGLRVPKPYAVDASGDVLGAPIMLVDFAPGSVIGDFLVVQRPDPGVALAMARETARLHAVPVDGLECLLPGGTVSVRERMRGELEGFDVLWRRLGRRDAHVVQAALDWMLANLDLADGPRCIVHRDIGVHNLLVDNGEATALLDWESVVAGTAAEDVAYSHYQVVQMMDWNDYIAAYEEASGTKLDRRQLDYYMLYASVRIAVGIAGMVAPVYTGERDSLLHYFIGDYFLQTLENRIAAKLAEILEC